MHRFLTLAITSTLAGIVAAGPLQARNPGPDGSRHKADRRHDNRKDHMDEWTIPPLFKELSPFTASRMEEMADMHSGKFRRVAQRVHRMMREMEGRQLPAMEEFERRANMMMMGDEIERLADKFRAAKDEKDRARLEKKLKEKLAALFDEKETAQRSRIKRMKKDLEEMKAKLDKRRRIRDRIIQRRLEELTGDADLRF